MEECRNPATLAESRKRPTYDKMYNDNFYLITRMGLHPPRVFKADISLKQVFIDKAKCGLTTLSHTLVSDCSLNEPTNIAGFVLLAVPPIDWSTVDSR